MIIVGTFKSILTFRIFVVIMLRLCRLILMIIYSSILPVKSINSTALTVKVRHSNDVHQVCDSKCETNPTKVFI